MDGLLFDLLTLALQILLPIGFFGALVYIVYKIVDRTIEVRSKDNSREDTSQDM